MCGSKKITYGYNDIPSEKDGWFDCEKYLPREYDLCDLKTPEKVLHGWHTGTIWDGLRLKESDSVLAWKRIKD